MDKFYKIKETKGRMWGNVAMHFEVGPVDVSSYSKRRSGSCNKMDLGQLPWFATFKLYRFIPSQRGDLVKIHLVARKLSNLDNVYMPHGIVGYTQTIDLMCKSANLVSVPRGDLIKL